MPGTIRIEHDGALATLIICNPGKLNALDRGMWHAMADELRTLRGSVDNPARTNIRCLRIRGDGPDSFAAGGDLEEFLQLRMSVDDAQAYHEGAVAPALEALANFPLPVVAQIDGPCIGGGLEIACCCDLRIASARSSFGAPILKLGFNMYAGELARVLATLPVAVVSEILLEGRILDSAEAFAKGLVTRVVADGTIEAESLATCRRISQGAPLVAREHKRLLRMLAGGRIPSAEYKRASLALVESDDYRAGLKAFINKETPRFSGC
jgi:enoyl-CoA hydratase/carnithine racemase